MNTQLAFAFGMLAMVAIIMVVVIVVGMVKVVKQQDKITSLEKWIDDTNRFADSNRRDLEQAISDDRENLQRVVSDEVRRISDEIETVHRRISEVHSILDSRFDKFEDKITKKQILKD